MQNNLPIRWSWMSPFVTFESTNWEIQPILWTDTTWFEVECPKFSDEENDQTRCLIEIWDFGLMRNTTSERVFDTRGKKKPPLSIFNGLEVPISRGRSPLWPLAFETAVEQWDQLRRQSTFDLPRNSGGFMKHDFGPQKNQMRWHQQVTPYYQ